ncbi:hypothetical protein Tco_1064308, partial [Tanacetum coccineum]
AIVSCRSAGIQSLLRVVDLTDGNCLPNGRSLPVGFHCFIEWASTCFNALLAGKVLSVFVLLLGFDLLAAEAPFTPVEGIPRALV